MIKTLWKSTKGYRFMTLITPIVMVIEVLMESAIVYTCRELVNALTNIESNAGIPTPIFDFFAKLFHITNTSLGAMVPVYAVLLVLMALISLAAGIGGGIFGGIASVGFAANLRKAVFYNIQDFSFENIDNFQSSSLVTRLTTDISMVQMSFQMLIRITVRAPLQMIMATIISFGIDVELSLFFVMIAPFLIFGLFMIIRVAMPTFNRLFKKYDKLNNSVQENIRGIRVVKNFVREDYEIDKFDSVSGNLAKEFTRAERIVALNSPIMQFCIHIAILLISYFGAKSIATHTGVFSGKENTLGVGDFQALITYGIQMLGSWMMLSMIFVMLSLSLECARRIVEVLNTKSNLVSKEDPIYEVKDGSIVFDNVNFKYSKEAHKYALYDINLNIPSGSTVGIIGGTGSSKTTLVNLISRLYDVTEGSVKVGGVDVRDYELDSLRNNVAVVLQKNVLFSGTIIDNLRWGKEDATLEEIEHVCKISQADDFIKQFPKQYETFIEQGGTNVSGGQKQRLCIARALLKNPKVIIFDDSTSAVDTKTDALIRAGLKEYLPDVTKIIIAQRIASVEGADIIIVMDNGTINGIGTHDELIKTNEIYQEVYYTQNKVGE